MKHIWFHFIIAAVLVYPAHAQQSNKKSPTTQGPDTGSIVDNAYVNEFLGFAYPIPDGWQVDKATIVDEGKVRAIQSGGGGLILLMIDQHTGAPLFSRIALSALGGESISLDVEGFVSKFGRVELDHAGVEVVRHAFPVEFAGRRFLREDYKESSGERVLYKAFICTKFRGYLLGWMLATPSTSGLEEAVKSLERISFRDESALTHDASASPGIVPGDQSGANLGEAIGPPPQKPTVALPQRVRISQRVSQGLLIKKVQPRYPEDARKNHIQGMVILQALIDKNGDVETLTLVSGDPALASAAIEAVKEWKYRPYLLEGQPVKVDTQIVVNFELSLH